MNSAAFGYRVQTVTTEREPTQGEADALCARCGICCTGAVLSGSRLEPSEVEFANRYHLRLVQTGKGPAFAHPCLLLEGTTCKAYSERPKACQAFRCKLLRQVTDGSLDVGTAVERIAEIRKRIADIEAALAPDERDALWWAAGLLGDPDTNSAQRAELSEMLKAVLSELTTLRQKTNDWIASPDDLSTWSSQEQRDR